MSQHADALAPQVRFVRSKRLWLALRARLKWLLSWLMMPLRWLFLLPRSFTVPFLGIAGSYFLIVHPLIVAVAAVVTYLVVFVVFILCVAIIFLVLAFGVAGTGIEIGEGTAAWNTLVWSITGFYLILLALITPVVFSVFTLGSMGLGLFTSHSLAGKFYGWRQRRRVVSGPPVKPLLPESAEAAPDEKNPLAPFNRIGIILSGGGAKGAYQAGALQAIFEFLEEHNAHGKVRMIAGTSIGSWNALFWLAGLVKKNGDGTSPLERWWKQISLDKIVQPITYIPTRRNHLLSNEPWRKEFHRLFAGTEAGTRLMSHVGGDEAGGRMNFYFTRSNIGKASLGYTTNNPPGPEAGERPAARRGECYQASILDHVRDGVFASMDIPPLFQYSVDNEDYFEDGGVIDNLPIGFGTDEECDLLFVLPLNASFEHKVDHRSVLRRLARVNDIRQGVLERNSFKMIYLYNEIVSLRNRVHELDASAGQRPSAPAAGDDLKKKIESKTADRALRRKNELVRVFAICPAPELKISTTEFWKTAEAGEAFDFMYGVTRNELKRLGQIVNSTHIRMIQVSPAPGQAGPATAPAAEPSASIDDGVSHAKPIRKSADGVAYDVLYFKDF